MDTTTRIISQEKVNTDSNTGLDRYSQVTGFSVKGENNGLITVEGRIALLSATDVCMLVESQWSYTRYDKAAVTGDVWIVDSPAIIVNDEIVTPEVGHYENQEITPANNKYTQLDQSPIGQGIKQMFGLDLQGAIDNGVWIPTNLNML